MSLFVITDGRKAYIRRDITGKYVPVMSRALADEFSERWKAKKVLENNLTPKKRKNFHILEEETGFSTTKTKEPEKKEAPKVEIRADAKDCYQKIDELKENIFKIQKFITDNEDRRSKLSDLLSNTDKEITDIQHYIEFSNLENEDSLKTYQMLKDRLKSRRIIKNELSILRQLSDCKMDASMFNDLLTVISELDNKTYVPRVLTELFN